MSTLFKALALTLLALALGLAAGRYWFGGPSGLTESISASSVLAQRTGGADAGAAALQAVQRGGRVITVKAGGSIQAAVHEAQPGDTIQVMPGIYKEAVYIDKDDITLFGVIAQGQWPTLEGSHELNDGILYSGNGVRIENMKVQHYKGNAIMGQAGNNFVIRHNWVVESGVYGIFPQYGQNGLIEHNVLSGIEDAAIYVGMCDHIHVAHNEVFKSVAGIEIENSRHAIVESNFAYDNAGGILVFITPGLPIKTTEDVIVRNNFIYDNNHENFAKEGSIVSGLPSGTGMVIMAGKDIVVENNIIRNNKNAGIIVVDHKSFSNITLDPEADPTPTRIQILDNFMQGNGTEPIADIKALMATQLLTGPGIDVVAAGAGRDNCMANQSRYRTAGLQGYKVCERRSTADVVSYLLPEPAAPRALPLADKGRMTYYAVCAGCHSYNGRLMGPPVLAIQALYEGDAKGLADYIAHPVKKRPDFPAMPSQAHLSPEVREAVAGYMLALKP